MTAPTHSRAATEHTPTPWRIHNREHSVVLMAERELELMSTSWHSSIRARYPLKAESLANAAYVLEAVNNYAALQARVAELTRALQELSRQKTSDEIEREGEVDPDECDFMGAYDTLIMVARRALSIPLEDRK